MFVERDIPQTLGDESQSAVCAEAPYQARPAELWVAETEVALDRPVKEHLRGKKSERGVRPLGLRFIVVRLRNEIGKFLAGWMLLSSVPWDLVSTEHLTKCYCWRWRIEPLLRPEECGSISASDEKLPGKLLADTEPCHERI